MISQSLTNDNLLDHIDDLRIEVYTKSNSRHRAKYGQFLTSSKVAKTMASMVSFFPDEIRILDPGAGIGILSAALISAVLNRQESKPRKIQVISYEIERVFIEYLVRTMNLCSELCKEHGISFEFEVREEDFIQVAVDSQKPSLFNQPDLNLSNLIVLNPPYKKLSTGSQEWRLLNQAGIQTTNLYAVFMWLSSRLLAQDGQMVSITPRSFCNGSYFRSFRKSFLNTMSLRQIHVYETRDKAFNEDDVLQENIIVYASKSPQQNTVLVTQSTSPDDVLPTIYVADFSKLVNLNDPENVIYLPVNEIDSQVISAFDCLESSLSDIGLSVSTGRVVDFRSRQYLRGSLEKGIAPLIYPSHFSKGFVVWPARLARKSEAIDLAAIQHNLLIPAGHYALVKRFSAKEEKRRVVAAVYDPQRIPHPFVGFENHVNYFHQKDKGLSRELAKGLAAYLNSTLVDWYFRQFSGSTQVNATDLRRLKYPDLELLERLGSRIGRDFPEQDELDRLLLEELGMSQRNTALESKKKIEGALEILSSIGVPRGQKNERSALTLLALLDLGPSSSWSDAKAPSRRISEMMDFFSQHYGVTYAPNTRETVRRYTVHQFQQLGIVVANPDTRNRPPNSPYYCYQVTDQFLALARAYSSEEWNNELYKYLKIAGVQLHTLEPRQREMPLIPVRLPDGTMVPLTAGGQNELIKQIVEEFCPRFTPGGTVAYLGDAGGKISSEQVNYFKSLGISLDEHGKIPDVIVYIPDKNWLVLIEAVTSHGPIDKKRHNELTDIFGTANADLLFVTAFASRRAMKKYLSELAWETEVWVADSPDHLIHFDGERFLGPY